MNGQQDNGIKREPAPEEPHGAGEPEKVAGSGEAGNTGEPGQSGNSGNSGEPRTYPAVRLFGARVSKLDMAESADWLADAVASGKPHQVVTINPIMLMTGLSDPAFMAVLKEAEFIVPDGAGAVWAASFTGDPVSGRVPGIDLMHRLMAMGEQRKWRVFLLGADPDTMNVARDNLRLQYPLLNIVGYRDGYFGEDQDQEVIAQIRAANPDLLFVGRSMSTQEPWIHRYKQDLAVPVMMGVGGSFDVIAGKVGRAPAWMQRAGLEWLYRLSREPSRWRRMLALPRFVLKVIRHRRDVNRDVW